MELLDIHFGIYTSSINCEMGTVYVFNHVPHQATNSPGVRSKQMLEGG